MTLCHLCKGGATYELKGKDNDWHPICQGCAEMALIARYDVRPIREVKEGS